MILSREKTELSNPQAVSEHIGKILRRLDRLDRDKEHFFVISLNTKNKVKFVELVSIGTTNSSPVHPREVFRRCIIRGASAAIVIEVRMAVIQQGQALCWGFSAKD